MMLLDRLEKLLTQGTLDQFQLMLNQNATNSDLYTFFPDGETLFHRLIKKNLSEKIKISFIYKLSDCGIDINAQNYTNSQTCLHLAVIRGQSEVVFCLLKNGADLTITDKDGLCAYNRARRLDCPELSKIIISKMQNFYPTYWIGIQNSDMSIIRRLVNSWCKFKVCKEGKSLIQLAKEQNFREAFELFKSLETTMDLFTAVLAGNEQKVEFITLYHHSDIKLNFKNMREKNATILYYAIKQNNVGILKAILKIKPYVLNEYQSDELDIDFPVYFAAIESKSRKECLQLLTPEIKNLGPSQIDISKLYYRGMSLLRYAIENNFEIKLIEWLMSPEYCRNELLTLKDFNHEDCKQFALRIKRSDYCAMLDRIAVNYILNDKNLAMQLALNGFDFQQDELKIEEESLISFAKRKQLSDLCLFLENVKIYQQKIKEFHQAVEKNDYYLVKAKFTASFEDSPELENVFLPSLLTSRLKDESQSVLFKAVLNGFFDILNLLLDLSVQSETRRNFTKFDEIRDHCFRTPLHYACGYDDKKKMSQLLSEYGFSENVFDKDGMTPLDFQERIQSEELQELISNHRNKKFNSEEPNPWSWKVWTRIQRERNTLKQIISLSGSKFNGCYHGNSQHRHHQNEIENEQNEIDQENK
ncbi:serine threonine- phosphatase 6 regulatory ankyrin repeat subunit A-like, partial [Brachionus plicatilis]